ncbi:MAG TPA: ATP-binding protein, partial [Burkholderiaceae bacterium]|nr:ATP-binding protein [Burkholderiaceae bacterium]
SIIGNAVEAVRPLIDAKQHRLVLELPHRPLRFDADALRLSQVIANLLSNAAKYTEPGGEIRLRAQASRGELCIEVSDNGMGMPPESLTDVFHMYTRLSSGDEGKPGGGLGIGLALARGLVDLHGGTITADSDGPGHGSRFTVRIPLLHVSQPGPREPVPASPTPLPARPLHVLIADDNEEAAQSLSALLQMQGHRVSCAYDGVQAVAAFRADPADVCLLDIGMPLQDGKEVARAIRALPGGERPVLIAITGWGQEADRREAIAAGFDHHLTKPVDPEHVLRLISASTPPQRSAATSGP